MGVAPTGNQIEVPGIIIHRIENGKIVEEWEQPDNLGLMQQFGVVPAPGEGGS
jgi:predicted ester cyclase